MMPTWDEIDRNVTPEAAQVLDHLLEDVRRQTISNALRQSYGGTISARDIAEAFEMGRQSAFKSYSPEADARRRRFNFLMAGYLAVAFAGFAAAIVVNFWNRGTSADTTQLLLLISSSVLSASTVLLVLAYRRRRQRDRGMTYGRDAAGGANAFLNEWIAIEVLLRRGVARILGESVSQRSIKEVSESLESAAILAPEEAADLRELSHFRNRVVHTGDFTGSELLDEVSRAAVLRRTLEKRLTKN